MSWFSEFFGLDDGESTKVVTIKSAPSAIESSTIVDPRSINVVKSHAIIGSIDKYGTFGKYNRLTKFLEDNEVKLAKAVLDDDEYLSNHSLALYPAVFGGAIAYGPGCFSTAKPTDPVYVLGDTHGDYETFIAILDTICSMAKAKGNTQPIVYLLGDVIDRNKESCALECSLIFAILQKALPAEFAEWNNIRLGIIKGDHDVCLSYEEPYAPSKRFAASVKPADYCDWLNERLNTPGGAKEENTYIGRAWIRLMTHCPAAAFLDASGTLLSHGGVPRSDIQTMITNGTPYIMQSEMVAQDFEWCRMVDAKNKLLNRGSKTSEIGFQEFDAFNKNLFGGRIKNFIFGHQHPIKGFQRYSVNYAGYDVLCMSSFRKDDSVGGPTVAHFCKIEPNEINVYSMNPAMYVVRLEENSQEVKKETIKA